MIGTRCSANAQGARISTAVPSLTVGEIDMLVPAYAATIHKSQGSEYPAVIIPVLTQHYPLLQRNLLYTGDGWSCWSGRRRPSPSRYAMSWAGGGGRS